MASVLKDKSYGFAIRMVNAYKFLSKEHEFIMSKQVLRSGTAIGALISETTYAQSKADFISKLSIALKEAHETQYWLCLLKDTEYLDEKLYNSLNRDLKELLQMLTASIKTAKSNKTKSREI